MPIPSLSETDLEAYRNDLSNPEKSTGALFITLTGLYQRFAGNEQLLANFEYASELQSLENSYTSKKEHYNKEIAELKRQFKQLDNRIIAAEQKLRHGIPDDLMVMDKIIAEQESIVEDQEKLNNAESYIVEQVRIIDIAHGKDLQKLEQQQSNRNTPLNNKFSAFNEQIKQAEKSITLKASAISVIAIIGIPLIIDICLVSLGLPALNKNTNNLIFTHYIFLITLILVELFLAEKIRSMISRMLSISYLKDSLDTLQNLLLDNKRRISKVESDHNISISEFVKQNYTA
ncbi:putative nucleic acid-binding Zn-ribbon protein [Flavobacterium sp. W4I14]|nr:putative nucleic acid-binding Zn-ribbon protein [Flavobacterium sp. W4I14]